MRISLSRLSFTRVSDVSLPFARGELISGLGRISFLQPRVQILAKLSDWDRPLRTHP
jgi:hypothetical protein